METTMGMKLAKKDIHFGSGCSDVVYVVGGSAGAWEIPWAITVDCDGYEALDVGRATTAPLDLTPGSCDRMTLDDFPGDDDGEKLRAAEEGGTAVHTQEGWRWRDANEWMVECANLREAGAYWRKRWPR